MKEKISRNVYKRQNQNKKMCLRERQLPVRHIGNKTIKVYLTMRKKKRRKLHMVINFLLYKYSQNETALKLQPASLLFQRRKAALTELIAMDMRKRGHHGNS